MIEGESEKFESDFATKFTRAVAFGIAFLLSALLLSYLGLSNDAEDFTDNVPYYLTKGLSLVVCYFFTHKFCKWLYS